MRLTAATPNRLLGALLFLIALCPPVLAAQSAAGEWEGVIEVPGQQLRVTVVLTPEGADGWTGTIDIPQQGADDLDLIDIRMPGDSAVFGIGGVPGTPTFRGVIAGDSIVGIFAQGPGTMPFRLVRADRADDASAAALDSIGPWIDEMIDAWDVPGVGVAVVKDGRVVHAAGYGLRDVEAGLPATERTLFAIGSSSKAFTAAAIGALVDEGLVSWDDPVRQHVPEFTVADTVAAADITIRDFLSHRSGLPRHDLVWYFNPEASRSELLDRLGDLASTCELRACWQYNNFGFMTAGVVVERVSGRSWEDFVTERFLNPLGMSRTQFLAASLPEADDFARGYDRRDGETVLLPYRSVTGMGPAGSINSSALEMAEWIRLQLAEGEHEGERLLAEATVLEMQRPQMVVGGKPADRDLGPMSYGMGWFVEPYRGNWRVHHGGNIDGFSALVDLYPDAEFGVVVLTNRNGTPVPQFIARGIADRMLGLEPRDWSGEALERMRAAEEAEEENEDDGEDEAEEAVVDAPPAHPLDAYAGRYAHPGYGTVQVRVADDALVADYGTDAFRLSHIHFEVFEIAEENSPVNGMRLRFLTGLDGSVEELEVALEPNAGPVRMGRVPDDRLTDPAFLARMVGAYRFETQTVRVSLRGDGLVVTIPGQPTYTLVPLRGTTFGIEGAPASVRVRFELDPAGEASAHTLTFIQPNGTFEYARIEDGDGG